MIWSEFDYISTVLKLQVHLPNFMILYENRFGVIIETVYLENEDQVR